ncbi:uncharacterized protein FOMMEDRAFT_165286 [Fomitiporia mediterranea MF3/22]|uniref:uncharacterized protein n=1 Tax=Fomitiporia mediterranea (strain MF3/22) TaxID=694068 RepID=UPI0004409B2C|nr:uncharacterized protein FOMMEDRAFT_165286 [Fomitiporia mediterranea MF3/22]EJD06504.1 hypothetical protein FOMMEDRAFT_165286 [Fomitiporia mediterranea MF3/22]
MRRGHGSTKVPGVKLRPPDRVRSKTADVSLKNSVYAQSLEAHELDFTEIIKSCKKPFVGVVVCASGISDKVNLFHQAVQLGAQTSSDLTDRVTHLICENPGSAKYNYCVEHGIPILLPSWISEVHSKWISGESIDVAKSSSVHRFPTFQFVRLCLTAVDDVQKRKQIRKQLEKNGGTFVETLGKDAEITHLLCGPDRGDNVGEKGISAKMQFVMKANRTATTKVHLVWEDWFWDCLEFKGILNEKEYVATGPRPQRRMMPEYSPLVAPIASSAEQIDRRAPIISPALDISQDVEEIANVRRVPEATTRLFENMLRRRGYEVKGGKVLRSPTRPRISNPLGGYLERSSTDRVDQRLAVDFASSRAESSLAAAFRRTKSFAVKGDNSESSNVPLQHAASTSFVTSKQAASSAMPIFNLHTEDVSVPDGEKNLFANLVFRTLGQANGPKLTAALELRGGTVVDDPEAQVDFIIVRLAGGNTFYLDEKDEMQRAKYRTECWVEQCMFEERICAAEEHPAFVPLRIPTPISGANKLYIHVSGLAASEKTPSVRLVKAIGATVTDQLSKRNTHLICPCGTGAKFDKAQEWRIPILNLQWLYATVKTGTMQEVKDYLVTAVAPENTGKGGMMMDITNSEFVQGSSKVKTPSKSSDRSQSSDTSIPVVPSSFTETGPEFSDSWVANALLSESVHDHPPTSSPALSTRSHGTSPTTPSKRKHKPTNLTMENTTVLLPFTSPTKRRSPTKYHDRVPSSVTPSPLKMPSKNTRTADHEASITPTTAPTATANTLSGESANVLKDAIASLLGKRPSSEDQDFDNNQNQNHSLKGQGQGQAPPTRASKRSKPPPRTKSRQDGSGRTFSRTTSVEALGRSGSIVSSTGVVAGPSYSFDFTMGTTGTGSVGGLINSIAESPADSDIIGLGSGIGTGGEADESMRVTYEDPSQRAEERRLLSLISGDAMDADAGREAIPAYEENNNVLTEEEKTSQPRPRRKGRNLRRTRRAEMFSSGLFYRPKDTGATISSTSPHFISLILRGGTWRQPV